MKLGKKILIGLGSFIVLASAGLASAGTHATITKIDNKGGGNYNVSGSYKAGATMVLGISNQKTPTTKVDHAGHFTFRNVHFSRSTGEFKVFEEVKAGWFGHKDSQVSDDYNFSLSKLSFISKQAQAAAKSKAKVLSAHATPTPTPKPTVATPTPTVQAAPAKTYTNGDGNQIQSPANAASVPAGATAQCGDGTYSFSQHRSGTCSHHKGVAIWY